MVFTGGLNKGDHQDSEGADRLQLGLPYGQDAVIGALAEANPNLAVAIVSGNAVAMPWIDRVPPYWRSGIRAPRPAMRWPTYCSVPSTLRVKLPFTFPVRLEDCSAHSAGSIPATGRSSTATGSSSVTAGSRRSGSTPVRLRPRPELYDVRHCQRAGGSHVACNDGQAPGLCRRDQYGGRAGAEVVQLYIGDKLSSLPRPVKELKGFEKVHLAPGQSRTVTFEIDPGMLACYDDAKGAWVAEPGEFTAYVGAASDDIRGTVDFVLK